MPPLPNPWIMLGAVVAMVAIAASAFFYGEHIDNLAWTAAAEKQKTEAARQLIAADQKTQAKETELADIKDKAEQTYQAHAQAITAALLHNRELDDQVDDLKRHPSGAVASGHLAAGGMQQPGPGQGGGGGLSNASAAPRLVAANAPATLLPGPTRADLIRLAFDADTAANYAGACRQYVDEVTAALAPPK